MVKKQEAIENVSDKTISFSISRKHLIFLMIFILVVVLFFTGSSLIKGIKEKIFTGTASCGDGTFYETCSINKPYFCLDGELIENSFNCGCPENFVKSNGNCVSNYETGEKEIVLKYFLEGQQYYLDFVVYDGVDDYLSGLPQSINYLQGEIASRSDFKLQKIDEEIQRDFLLPLVVKIQNSAPEKEEQMRIAVSLVQNIEFGQSNETILFGETELNYSRYPYQVLYDEEGICGEKTELLAFLLRELGYGVSFFYYGEENHEAFGIKCPVEKSFMNSGYCFVETTAPSIIGDNEIEYVGIGKLNSVPDIFLISDGLSLGNNLYEYKDSEKMKKIRNSIEKDGKLNFFEKRTLENLKEKYGLVEDYYSG